MEPEVPFEAELTFEQKIQVLMSTLPQPVQDFLHSPERDAVSLELSTKYNLHTDQAGVFERSFIYMLLGVLTPDEFVQELNDAHISEETVRGLTTDVNERVFKKLQGAERNPVPSAPLPPPIPLQPKPFVPAPVPVPPAPAPFTPPAPPKPEPPAIPIYVPPAPPAPMPPVSAPSPFTPPPLSMPVPPPAPPKPVFSAPHAPMPPPPPRAHPPIRTMASDMQLMKGEPKHPHEAPVAPPAWQPASQARTFQTSSVPNTAPPAPQPAPPAPPAPPVPPMPHPFPMPTPPPNLPGQPAGTHPEPMQPIVKEYGVDPYRETPG